MKPINSYRKKSEYYETTDKDKFLTKNWLNFFKKGINLGGIRPVIMASWQRSLKYEIDPNVMIAPTLCDNKEIAERIESNKTLLNLIRPFMDDLYEMVKGTDSIIAFSDKEGVVLELFGDSEIAMTAASVNFKVGINMSEQAIGTNSIGTSIVLGKAIQVVGAEHYCVAWHTSHCSSAPIKDPYSGNIIGTITLIGYLHSAHPHSLGLVKTASDTIARLIEQNSIKKEQYLIDNFFNAALDSISDGILIVNRLGEIIRSNKIATHLLKFPLLDHCKNKLDEIEQLLPLSRYLDDSTKRNEIILQDEISLSEEKYKLFMTSRKIIVEDEYLGNIIILRKKFSKEINKLTAKYRFSSLVGEDPSFKTAINLAAKAARTDRSILIIGESGTGKELFAQAIHNESLRQNEPFLAINCAAIPKDLITSELFGYVEGAFTNAAKGGRKGKFEVANGGTIFLDEIGDMPLELQAHLLRVLEEKEITPVGSHISKPIDIRIIAATNKDLFQLVKENKFRLDLFYRLNVISIQIPSLKKRKQDIDLFIKHFLPSKEFSTGVLTYIYEYNWPGNLREFRNVMEQIEIFCEETFVTEEYIPDYIRTELQELDDSTTLYQSLANETRKDTMIATLKNSGSVSQAAKRLGVSSSTLYRWASEYHINIKDYIKTNG
ncbi:sigma-54-dependent Fis family transcriptional regulator [Neobacillus drentensis]|uniref:sigma-54-dependent Fis family transcriptional regulator n=1 Tax=Neobacillus drentensis TaxID=220684 RepID=UPI0028675492|nr:sigma-54-dependent Fis family transcriptional regulator [Neobacillus drentensis]MDR7238100.1 transcriptional regulator of acetoin/glycerol metabolism [Neobacillus drentensis]